MSDLESRVAALETKVEMILNQLTVKAEDHEDRLRALEKWMSAVPVSAIMALVTLIIGLVSILLQVT